MAKSKHRGGDAAHAHDTHERWRKRFITAGIKRDPGPEQCGGCAFYLELRGVLGTDWGVCSNPASPQDGSPMFEHDWCEHIDYSGW